MGIVIYLFFNGNAEEAMNFYAQATGGSILNINRYGDNGMACAESEKGKVMHGIITVNGSQMMFSDCGEKKKAVFGDNFSVSVDYKNEDDMRKAFEGLVQGGTVVMPLQDTFWGATFGMLTDKFGVNWMFNHDKPKA